MYLRRFFSARYTILPFHHLFLSIFSNLGVDLKENRSELHPHPFICPKTAGSPPVRPHLPNENGARRRRSPIHLTYTPEGAVAPSLHPVIRAVDEFKLQIAVQLREVRIVSRDTHHQVLVLLRPRHRRAHRGRRHDVELHLHAAHIRVIGYRIADALNPKPASGEEEKAIPRNFDKSSTSGDLSYDIAKCIIERGAEGVSKDAYGQVTKGPAAIIFDEEAIKTANSYVNSYGNPDDAKNCPNLKLIYDVYNNLGAKLACNWMSGSDYDYSDKLSAASAQQGYRNFSYNETDALGKSQFVYNYTGEDDSWLTTDFGNESKVAKTALNAPAFTDVNTFINADCGNSMSVAKMFMAINLEADAYNQPDHLRILEIEPNEQYMYNANDKDSWVKYYLDLMPWYVGTSADIGKDVTITAMPTYEFIGKNEDVNENYDMIIIGNHQQDETNGAQGYNDTNDLTWEEIENPTVGVHGLWSYDGKDWNTLSYTAVGDYITTYGI